MVKVSKNEYKLLGISNWNSVVNISLNQYYKAVSHSYARYKGVCFPGDIRYLCWWEGEWPVKDSVWVPAQKGGEMIEVQWEELTLFRDNQTS